ncbi:MAG: hypothetical protein BWY91_03003 [bacterium ADurb.BinA028]|nr:MAG: hypothetical protein BWY91_03003 [bacterium ADurb.BinA028]
MMTMNIGVTSRLAPSWTKSLVPWKELVAGNRRSTNCRNAFSSYSSSSLSPSRANFQAVQMRKAPKM